MSSYPIHHTLSSHLETVLTVNPIIDIMLSRSRSGALAQPDRKAQLEKLRALLVSKRDIESRISASIEGLETAYNTTSKELILVLKARAEATSQA